MRWNVANVNCVRKKICYRSWARALVKMPLCHSTPIHCIHRRWAKKILTTFRVFLMTRAFLHRPVQSMDNHRIHEFPLNMFALKHCKTILPSKRHCPELYQHHRYSCPGLVLVSIQRKRESCNDSWPVVDVLQQIILTLNRHLDRHWKMLIRFWWVIASQFVSQIYLTAGNIDFFVCLFILQTSTELNRSPLFALPLESVPPIIERDEDGRPVRRGYVPVEEKIQKELREMRSRETELKRIRRSNKNALSQSQQDLLDKNIEDMVEWAEQRIHKCSMHVQQIINECCI